VKQGFTLEVTEGKLIQRRADSIVEIPLREMDSLNEMYGWLVVKSGEKQIMVPPGIGGFDYLKTQLAKHRPITPLKSKTRWLSWVSTIFMIAACVVFFSSHQRRVIELSGAAIFILQASAIFSLRRFLWAKWAKGKAALLLLYYIVTLLLIVWIMLQRVKGSW
jgi:hypothetical protein